MPDIPEKDMVSDYLILIDGREILDFADSLLVGWRCETSVGSS
jgi:hypothetical protein